MSTSRKKTKSPKFKIGDFVIIKESSNILPASEGIVEEIKLNQGSSNRWSYLIRYTLESGREYIDKPERLRYCNYAESELILNIDAMRIDKLRKLIDEKEDQIQIRRPSQERTN